MKMTATRQINRPADEVFAFLADATNNPKWQDGMVACEWRTPPPIGADSIYEQHARFMGRDVKSVFVVTEHEPGRSIKIETIESTFPITVQRWVEQTGPRSCTVNAKIGGGPTGLMRLLEPLVARRAQRSVDADYDRLQIYLNGAA